ncbi:TPA: hypothetical protein R5B57_001643 [Campylobacter jejuni]|uniref:Lipoprotein n=1 Tax=Campylobacter jejuni TaxID=197 RepID=A0A5T0DLG6_CAMJU|nr:hypothetical protein [Campylobacter jejuni]EAH9643393.1 hypothetical protein [Campylobacter jejuni]EAI5330625.1 hypothetical protein [Campylobacter jejuni]EAI6923434.1 hypothetical protein [Campylobacter jejuni]EAI8132518.1 hypothetical protein [Campylobacter jejuni]
MKKILTSALALGAMTLIIGCGDGDLVELKNNGNDQTMFDLGNQEIMKKYPNYKLYDLASLKNLSSIKEGKEIYVWASNHIKDMKKQSPEKYSNYIFLTDKDKNYRLVLVSCLKDYCSVIDKTKDAGLY